MIRRFGLVALLVALAGCAGNADDSTWEDAGDVAPDAAVDARGRDVVDDALARPDAEPDTPPSPDEDALDGGADADAFVRDATADADAFVRDADADAFVRDAVVDGGREVGDAGSDVVGADAGGDPDSADAAPDTAPDAADAAAADAADAADAGPDVGPDIASDVGPDVGLLLGECPAEYAAPIETGRLDTVELDEASGIAASRRAADVLWLHNDSGDSARLFAVRDDGRVLAILTLADVRARDFEDLSAAPCPDGSGPCLWVGDVGDNNRNRSEVTVHVVREPALPPPEDGIAALETAPDWVFPFTYPDGPMDSEGVAVAPDGSTFYVFEKADLDQIRVFAHPGPLDDGVGVTLVERATFAIPQWTGGGRKVTGADLHPTGRRLLLRTYAGSAEYRFGEGQGVADLGAITGVVVARGPSSEPQGEAGCYDATGIGFWTVSESAAGNQPLHYYPCL